MAGNVGFDWLLGLIPWVGAIPDFFFRSNTRNLKMIKRHLDKHHAGHRDDRGRGHPPPLAAVRDPFVLAFDLVGDRPAIAVGARAIAEALLDQPAGQRIELGHAARSGDGAAADQAVRLDR